MASPLSGLLRQLGLQIGRRPIAIFLANLLIFLPTLSYFLLFDAKIETDVRRGFAHQNGRAAKELEAFGEFYNVTMDGLEILLVFLEAKEPAKRLKITGKLLAEIDRLDRKIKGMNVKMDEENEEERNGTKIVRLEQFQTSRGDVNFLFRAYKWAHQRQEAQLLDGSPLDSQIHLDHPISRIYGFQVPLSSHFFGVQFWEQKNGTDQTLQPSKMESASYIALWYMFEGRGPRMRQALAHLELELFELAKIGQFSDLFDIHLYGDEIANFEMMRGSQQTIRLLAIGIGAMVAFMLVAFRQYKWKSQLILIAFALLSPSLAIMVTFALLGWFGIQFNAIMSIMPFLVLGIGVDNAFLLLHSWRKWSRLDKEKDKSREKKENLIVPERMAAVIGEMGPSIAITSITNGLAFGIGVFSPSSLMSSFCLCTTVAIGLDFLFEFLVFAPCLPFIEWCHRQQQRREKAEIKMRRIRIKFCHAYAAFIVSRWAKLVAAILLCIAYALSVLGIDRMEATFEPQKTFPADSALQTSIGVINRVMTENSPVSLIVFRPPNVGIPRELAKFQQMIGQLGSLPNALRIDIWLDDYLEYDRLNFNKTHRNSLEYSPSYSLVPQYLRERMMEDKRIVEYRKNIDGTISVDKFVFILYRWGELSWHERAFFVDTLRSIVDQFPEFSVTVFDYDSTIYDLILTVKTELLKAVLVTLTCMALVCFFIIPNLRTSSIATFSVLSISFTLMGALGWWGLDMDPVTMINVLMAIGFSVDFSAHICYHFNKMIQQNLDDNKMDRNVGNAQRQIESILNAVGRPMLEAAISTVICVFPLFFISMYIIEAFARTVFCLGAIGLVHGLFIVPVLLSLQLSNGGKFEEKSGGKCHRNEGGKMLEDDNKSASMASSNQPLILPNGEEENENGTKKLLASKMAMNTDGKEENEEMIMPDIP